jgi:hypothetical protein
LQGVGGRHRSARFCYKHNLELSLSSYVLDNRFWFVNSQLGMCVCADAVAMYICTCGKLTCRDLENTTKRLRRIRKLESLSSLQKDDVVADLRRKPIDAVTDRLDTFSSSQKGRSSIARRGFFPTGVREVVMK